MTVLSVTETTRWRDAALAAGSMDAADFAPLPSSNGHAEPKVRLNLGAGGQPLEGFQNLDRKTGQEAYPLSWEDGTVDEIRASHVLEHFSHREVPVVLENWVRALRPGGLLKVAVPDFELIARAYLEGKPINVQGYVMGGHVDADDRHGAIFDEEELTRQLRTAGLWDIRPWKSELQDCASLPISLNLQGKKKKPLPTQKIGCAMSVPRLGFQDNFFCWARSLYPLGIVPCKYDGAFWGQCLERVMMEMGDKDLILTVDYDTVYDRDAVEDLLRLAAEYPTADAIAPVQIRRQGDTCLACIRGPDGKLMGDVPLDMLQADLVPVSAAHFGLTLIRVEALRKLKHPWFHSVPDASGQWGEGRLDDDIYFWRQWEAAGNTLFLAPHVVTAHAQLMLTWPGRGNLRPVHQHPNDFWKTGKPAEVWR